MKKIIKEYLTNCWTVPNLLSFLRILMVPAFAVLFMNGHYLWSIAVLALSGLSFGLGAASKWTGFYAGAGLAVLWLIDRINRVNGTETIVLGSQQYTRKDGKGKADVFANAIKHDFRSKNPTTRWSDIIKLK